MTPSSRLVLHETKRRPRTTHELAALMGVETNVVRTQAAELNDRLKKLLSYERDPVEIDGSGAWRVDGVAGLLRLNDRIEIEVVPKFLDPDDESWRTDFFLLAVLVRTGHVLPLDEISADIEARGDLATLVARALIRMHADNGRRPIRGYTRLARSDFSFDGDVDWDSMLLPEADGFRLQGLELTRRNEHNAVLKAAIDALLPEVAEGDTRAIMQRLSHAFGHQPKPHRAPPSLPQRHRPWSQAYSLSQFVLDGMGLKLGGGEFTGPGFVISTWAAWQSLCEEVVRRATPGDRTSFQHSFQLGWRADGTQVDASPDIAVLRLGRTKYLLDAKYKTRQGKKPAISSTDLYEGLAFLRASKAKRITLLYPALQGVEELPLGSWKQFDEVTVDDLRVRGIEVQVRGLARRDALMKIAGGIRMALERPELEGSRPSVPIAARFAT